MRINYFNLVTNNKRTSEFYKDTSPTAKYASMETEKLTSEPFKTNAPATDSSSKLPPASMAKAPNDPMKESLDLLNKIEEIVTNDYPSIKNEFDFSYLQRGINNGYYFTLEEFKVAAKQIIRAIQRKHQELDLSSKLIHSNYAFKFIFVYSVIQSYFKYYSHYITYRFDYFNY